MSGYMDLHIKGHTNAANLSRRAYIRCVEPMRNRTHFLGLKHDAGLAEHVETQKWNDPQSIQHSRIFNGECWNLTLPRGSVLRHASYMSRWWSHGAKTSLQRKECAKKSRQKARPTGQSWVLCPYHKIKRVAV